MKGLIKAVAGFDVIGTIADKFDAKIHERFGLPYPVPTYAAQQVKSADNLAFEIERKVFTRTTNAREDLDELIRRPRIASILDQIGITSCRERVCQYV